MKTKLLAFLRDETGLTMVEYAVGGALIICACVVAITAVGTNASAVFDYIAGKLTVPG